MPDEWYAKTIRETIKSLSKVIADAKSAGLKVSLDLSGIGTGNWIGYDTSAKITREY